MLTLISTIIFALLMRYIRLVFAYVEIKNAIWVRLTVNQNTIKHFLIAGTSCVNRVG